MATREQEIVRLSLAVGGFLLWGYLMITGRQLQPATTAALLFLILAMTGLGSLISDVTGRGTDDQK